MFIQLLRCLCLLFIIRNLSAELENYSLCCKIYNLFSQDSEICNFEDSDSPMALFAPVQFVYDDVLGQDISFNCSMPKVALMNKKSKVISQFDGTIGVQESSNSFYQINENWFVLNTVTINTTKDTELSRIPDSSADIWNTYEIKWQMHGSCHLVNEITNKLQFTKVIILNVFDWVDLNDCEDFSLRNAVKLTKLHINLNKPHSSENITSMNKAIYAFRISFLADMKNLKYFKLNCASKRFEVHLPKEMFRDSRNLEEIALESCSFNNFSAEHFKGLTNLRVVNLSDVFFDDFHWISSETLANHVTLLNINYASSKSNNTYFNDIRYFENYTNLNTIFFDPPPYKTVMLSGSKIFSNTCKGNECTIYRNQIKIFCPPACHCVYENQKMRLRLNCRMIEFEVLFKPEDRSTALYMSKTNLTKLPDAGMYNYSNVRELHLANNRLDELSISQLPRNLTVLDIRNNSFKFLRPEVIKFLEHRKESLLVNLSGNPWNCDCHPPVFLKFIERVPNMINDLDRVECDGKTPGSKMDVCRLRITYLIIGLSVLFIVVCAFIFWFRTPILIWLYYHNICVNFIRRTAENIEFYQRFDGFLAFCHKNFDLVNEYVEQLENGPREFKLCFYQRDWAIGQSIPACILRSIEDSRRIILLMTNQFIKSSWGTFEFRTAIKATSMNPNKRLIIIVYPDVENFEGLDSELRLYMKYNTYLRRDDPQFWKKLIYWMPHKKVTSSKRKTKRNGEQGGES